MKTKNMGKIILIIGILIILMLNACGFDINQVRTLTNTAVTENIIPEENSGENNEIPDSLENAIGTANSEQCAYVWTSRKLPELTTEIQDDFLLNGFKDLVVSVEAYGENCIDPDTNTVKYFTPMQTDFHITLETPDLSDTVTGNYLYQILDVLSEYPEELLPGSMPGHVGVRFGKGNQDRYFWFSIVDGINAYKDGYKGKILTTILEK